MGDIIEFPSAEISIRASLEEALENSLIEFDASDDMKDEARVWFEEFYNENIEELVASRVNFTMTVPVEYSEQFREVGERVANNLKAQYTPVLCRLILEVMMLKLSILKLQEEAR